MSWMDSWSRPAKSSAIPPPLYLTHGDSVRYCQSCGRVIGSRKAQSSQEVKYCSSRCRTHKPGLIDRKIERVFLALLRGEQPIILEDGTVAPAVTTSNSDASKQRDKKGRMKGDQRVIVQCSDVETLMFGPRSNPEHAFGRKKNRPARGVADAQEWKTVDMMDESEEHTTDEDTLHHDYGAGKVRPVQSKSDVNGSIGGEKGWAERGEETEEMKQKRLEGQRKVEEREMVRRAARRACVFGLQDEDDREPVSKKGKDGGNTDKKATAKKKCEAVMQCKVVEPSFAKGEWGIRWRED